MLGKGSDPTVRRGRQLMRQARWRHPSDEIVSCQGPSHQSPSRQRQSPSRSRPLRVAAAAVAGVALAACGSSSPGSAGAKSGGSLPTVQAPKLSSMTVPSFYKAPSPLPPGTPGTLIRAERVTGVTGVPGVPANARVWRIVYHSRTVANTDVAVSGYVVAPAGPAPKGGYPVLAWDHGTTGMAPPCAPSLFTNLDGQQLYLAPYLKSYLKSGYAVAATDYQGLGTDGLRSYLVGEMEGRNTLDSVRAAAHLRGLHLSRNVVVVGHSQGGQASLFSGQLAPSYAPKLNVEGVVAIAPATNLKLAVVASGSLSSQGGISHGQGDLDFIAMALWAWTHTYSNLAVSKVFTPVGVSTMAVAGKGCLPQIAVALKKHSANQLFQPGTARNPVVLADAARNDAGMTRTPAPMLVIQGTGDQTVPYQLTEYFVDNQACPIGDHLRFTLYQGRTHSGVIAPAGGEVLAWIAKRFAAQPVPDTCGAAQPQTVPSGSTTR